MFSAIGSDRANTVQVQFVYRTSLPQLPDGRLAVKNAGRDGRAFATKARNWLINTFGPTHTLAWSAAGFDNDSIEIPRDDAGLESLLERMYLYFSNNPGQENMDPKVNVSAARAQTFCLAPGSAVGSLNGKAQDCGTKKGARDTAAQALRKRLRGLVQELGQSLADDDARWRQFGLNLPAAKYATHYRFFTQRPDADEEPVHVGNSDEPMFHLTGLTAGGTLEIYVTAANAGAECLFSKPVSATVAGAEEAAEEAGASLMRAPALGRGSRLALPLLEGEFAQAAAQGV